MHPETDSIRAREWQLRPYLGITLLTWLLGLTSAAGGTQDARVEWPGALVNLALLIPLWRGARWPAAVLAIEATVLVGVIGPEAFTVEKPIFGLLALLAVGQLLLMCSLWADRELGN